MEYQPTFFQKYELDEDDDDTSDVEGGLEEAGSTSISIFFVRKRISWLSGVLSTFSTFGVVI